MSRRTYQYHQDTDRFLLVRPFYYWHALKTGQQPSQLGVPCLLGFRVEFHSKTEEIQLAYGDISSRMGNWTQLIISKIPYFASRYLALSVPIGM